MKPTPVGVYPALASVSAVDRPQRDATALPLPPEFKTFTMARGDADALALEESRLRPALLVPIDARLAAARIALFQPGSPDLSALSSTWRLAQRSAAAPAVAERLAPAAVVSGDLVGAFAEAIWVRPSPRGVLVPRDVSLAPRRSRRRRLLAALQLERLPAAVAAR